MHQQFKPLIEAALHFGATHATIISPGKVPVDPKLAGHCLPPQCPNYNTSACCPPNVSGPKGMTSMLAGADFVLVFKMDVPSKLLKSFEARELFRQLHRIASGVEAKAIEGGFPNSKGFASGGCKTLYCEKFADCPVLTEKGACRFADVVRPSISGFGVDATKLMEAAGWRMKWLKKPENNSGDDVSSLVGLVILDKE